MSRKPQVKWQYQWNRMLGKYQDGELAAKLGVSPQSVRNHRKAKGIPRCWGKKKVKCRCGKTVYRYAANRNINCRACLKAYKEQWRADKLEQRRAYHLAWCQRNREQDNARKRAWKLANLDKVRLGNKLRMRKTRASVKAELDALPCLDCGGSHGRERREQLLRRLLPCTIREIREIHPCLWGPPEEANSKRERELYRDLHRLGAVRLSGTWYPASESRAA